MNEQTLALLKELAEVDITEFEIESIFEDKLFHFSEVAKRILTNYYGRVRTGS